MLACSSELEECHSAYHTRDENRVRWTLKSSHGVAERLRLRSHRVNHHAISALILVKLRIAPALKSVYSYGLEWLTRQVCCLTN